MRNFLLEQDDPKLSELQTKEGDTEVKKMRNAISRLAKQKGYKLSYWQTANRNARTVYTTYGIFSRDQKRPMSFESCDFTKGFTGHPGKTSTTRGGEFKALKEIEEWLNSQENYKEVGEMNSKTGWIVLGVLGNFSDIEDVEDIGDEGSGLDIEDAGVDYEKVKEEYDSFSNDPDVELFDFTEMPAGNSRTDILEWGIDDMGFDYVDDEWHPFGGYFETNGKTFTGAAASPAFIVMIPNQGKETMSESRKHIKNLLKEVIGDSPQDSVK
jgi:hypothetical protein